MLSSLVDQILFENDSRIFGWTKFPFFAHFSVWAE